MSVPERPGMGGHQSAASAKDEWLTPPHIIQALGGPDAFDLDPASPVVRPWPTAQNHYTVNDNGLVRTWGGPPMRVFLNPPYGGPAIIGPWMRRMADHGNGIALIFARTETDVFFETVWKCADALLFLRGRLHFHHVDGRRADHNAGAPSVLVAYGSDAGMALCVAKIPGKFIYLRGNRERN